MPHLTGSQPPAVSSGLGKSVMPGVYLRNGTIVEAVDFKKAELPFEKHAGSIGVVLGVNAGGQFNDSVIVAGKPYLDNGVITAFGFGAEPVNHLFTVIGYKDDVVDTSTGEVSPKALAALIGKTVCYILYVKGQKEADPTDPESKTKAKFGTYRWVTSIDDRELNGPAWITQKFQDDYNDGFVPKYAPKYAPGGHVEGTTPATATVVRQTELPLQPAIAPTTPPAAPQGPQMSIDNL